MGTGYGAWRWDAMPGSPEHDTTLFVVHVTGAKEAPDLTSFHDAHSLNEGLFLVRTSHSQSKLYHAVKRQCAPASLFVGALGQDPKFKGMAEGALKWLRDTAHSG